MAPYRFLQWLYHQTVGRFVFAVRRRRLKGQGRVGSVLRLLGDILLFPFHFVFSLLWMVTVEWTTSRQGRLFLQGLPAVVFGLGTVTAIAFQAFYPKDSLIRSYERYANEAVKDERYEEARICYEKLAVLQEGHDEHPFRVAVMLFEEEDEARAIGIMQTLAPLDPLEPPGFAPAHLWMWRHLMSQEMVTLAMRAQARQHLRRAVEADSEDPNIRLLYARMLVREGKPLEALPYYEQLADKDPEIRMEYAESLRANAKASDRPEEEQQAIREINLAQEEFRSRVRRDPLDMKSWIRLHQCHIFKREFRTAISVLNEAQLATGNEDLRQAQARVLVASADFLIKEGGGLAKNFDAVVQQLDQALALAPNDQAALALLVIVVNSPEIETDTAISLLQEKLVDSQAPAMVHFLLGSKYAQKSAFDQALFHFERARKNSPQTAAILNNMAWVLSNMPLQEGETEEDGEKRLEQALNLINQAIKGDPERITYYDTRGQIRVKLGMFKEALDDLERAIPTMSDKSAKFHEALAACYDEAGQSDLARVHREKAEEILARVAPSPND